MLSIVFSRARVQGELLSETFTCAQRTGEPIEEDVEAPYVCWKKSAFGTALAVETSKRRIRPKIPKRAARDEVGASPRWQAPVLGHTILLLTGFCSWAMSGAANEATGLLFPQLLRDFQVNPAQVGLAATSFTLGNACGLVLGGGARMGHRQMVLTGLVVAIGSSLLLLVASRFETLLLARTCLGLAAGLFTIAVPALLAEGLPKTKAEAYLATYPSGWPIGAFVAILTAGNHWRWALGVGPLIASLILLPCLLWLPESPQYLLLKGRRKEAERALKKLGTKEEQIVHADTGSAPTGSPTGAGIPFKRLAATLMCRHAASIIVKMWLPVYLGTHGQVGSAVAAMLLMYLLEALGILVTGRLVAGGGNDVLANGARWSLIAGVVATLGCLFCQGSVLAAGLLGATHLIAQANASNLLMAYATCNCSTAARNQTLSRLNFLSFLSGSMMVTVQNGSFHHVERVLLAAAGLYGFAAALMPR